MNTDKARVSIRVYSCSFVAKLVWLRAGHIHFGYVDQRHACPIILLARPCYRLLQAFDHSLAHRGAFVGGATHRQLFRS